MKKTIIAIYMAVVLAFLTAVTLCIQTLNGTLEVSTFASGGMRIVLDAGHGGIDGGVTGRTTGVKESDINLAIVYKLCESLTDMGFEVTLTRKTDAGLYDTATKGFKKRDMQKRKEIIEATKPLLVISVHQNYYPSKSSRGAQVFYSKKSEDGKRLAGALQDSLNEAYKKRGVKARNIAAGEYFMLECTPYPSVIVETGFLSSPEDERLLRSDDWQRKLVSSIVTGIVNYLSQMHA